MFLAKTGKEGWIVTKSGFAVSLFFKRQFWLWREEAPEQDYLVLSPENPLEMEFKSVAKLFNNNFKRSLAFNLQQLGSDCSDTLSANTIPNVTLNSLTFARPRVKDSFKKVHTFIFISLNGSIQAMVIGQFDTKKASRTICHNEGNYLFTNAASRTIWYLGRFDA